MKVWKVIAGIVVVIIVFIIGRHNGEQHYIINSSTDTVITVIRDTFIVEQPTIKERKIIAYDTIHIPIEIAVNDSSNAIVLPIEQKTYSDSTDNCKYTAFVSGYNPNLDSIYFETLSEQQTITITPKDRRVSIGLQAGYGVSKTGLSPYIGIGLQYKIFK